MNLSSLSLSSQATTLLCAYRNQLRSEELWWSGHLDINGQHLNIRNISGTHPIRDLSSTRQRVQPLYYLLVVTAAIEAISYTIFLLLNIDSSSTAKLKSSIFTLFWNLSNLSCNPMEPNINTLECFARHTFTHRNAFFCQNILPNLLMLFSLAFFVTGLLTIKSIFFKNLSFTPFSNLLVNNLLVISIFFSLLGMSILFGIWSANQIISVLLMNPNDKETIYQFVQNNIVHFEITDLDITNSEKDAQELILKHVLREGSLEANTLEKLMEIFDPNAILLASTKIVYLYAFGPNKEKPIPTFFSTKAIPWITSLRKKHGTTFEYTFGIKKGEIPKNLEAASILALRKKYPTNPFVDASSSFFYSLDNFNADLDKDDPLKPLWTDLKGAGTEAAQGSPLIYESLGKAIKIITANS